ncbi:MAG TPA: RNA methyltransferase, partial [Bacillales bacterium]|nr:RNA methyltransferase [Bacillales bacterium]
MYIESKKNPRVKEWKKLHMKKGRDRSGLFLIEGYHMVEEALAGNVEVVEVIFQERADLPLEWELDDIPLYAVTTSVLKEISETQNPQGIAAVCRKRESSFSVEPDGKYLCIDAVQDPGNVGTMIRTADAAGLTAVILGEGCADPYNG